MKILQLCYEFPPIGGGASRVVDGLSRELARRGHEVHVVTMAFRGRPRTEVTEGVAIHRIPCLRLTEARCSLPEAALYLLAAPPELRRLAAEHDFDINHTHFVLPDGILAEALAADVGLPYIVTTHGSDVPGYNPHRLRLAHALARRRWQRVARGAAALVCPSESLQEQVRRRDPTLSTTVIPYGFESGRYSGAGERKRRILVVTRLLRRKGIQYLLEALRGLALEHDVHVVGAGLMLRPLRRAARRTRTRVVFHGWLDNRSAELDALYESSDIFVLPSERENFPVALMEAMAAGMAVITTEGTGCAEVVGDTAVLVPPRSAPALRAAILELTADPERCRRLGSAARERVERHLSWTSVADRYLELYELHGVRRGAEGSGVPAG